VVVFDALTDLFRISLLGIRRLQPLHSARATVGHIAAKVSTLFSTPGTSIVTSAYRNVCLPSIPPRR